MVAVGLSSGDVALHKLYGTASKGRRSTDGAYSEPVRVLSLYDWGYGPEALGPVAALQWAPNNRALAVRSMLFCRSWNTSPSSSCGVQSEQHSLSLVTNTARDLLDSL